MKTLVFLLAVCFVTFPGSSQTQTIVCGTDGSQAPLFSPAETHGIYRPAQGDMKVLVVFARFKDDISAHTEWPAGSDPSEYTTWIDPTMQTGSTNLANLTHYFNEMSRGLYRVTGVTVSVETPNNRSYYIEPGKDLPDRFLANKEVLQLKVDPLVNFADFDNWTYNSDYHHTETGDGIVDMVVMIWRGHPFASWGGEASLGGTESFSVESGTKTIATRYRAFGGEGSGVTVHYGASSGSKYVFHSAVHEIAHWLLGAKHPYYDYGGLHFAKWGMLAGSFEDGICANTYEREHLGWISPAPAVESASLPDFITSGVAYKFQPTSGSSNEYYYFENHQKLSIYDDATSNPNDKGIWVLHQRDVYNGSDNIRIKPQDGFWDWENPRYNTTCFSPVSVAAFRRLSVNRNSSGRSIRNMLLNSLSIPEWPHAYIDHNGNEICGGFFRGDPPFFGAYNTILNNVFSRWSNPTSNTWTDAPVDFAMHVVSQNGSTLSVWFYTSGDAISAPPSKPQDVRLSSNSGSYGNIRVSWRRNIEGDITSYQVWRAVQEYGGTYQLTGTTTDTFWVDPTYLYAPGGGDFHTSYKVRAKDNQNLFSVYSDPAQVRAEEFGKLASSIEVVTSYSLDQNYPNPFNPVTTITFSLPEASNVELKVFDILGREVGVLVDGLRESGVHVARWDAGKRASGVYLARLLARDELGQVKYQGVTRLLLAK